ncbi:hypothetical protein F5876DRAFT_70120 [Lentinula aff. lateritia]|uniref:Uncharacterized protein n=1 Tax=Lentinula aff. lateritia TaxID=2804960 RepID=A0ACC1TK44_9AGAR|nr:hypothetical protein F5876DRAFT_70120 [Lentinula aff. lateritia]
MDAVRRVAEELSRVTVQPSSSGEGSGGSLAEGKDLRKDLEGLVNAGVVEALCRNVIELKGDTMADDAMSSFYPPFVILYFVVIGMSNGDRDERSGNQRNTVDRRALSAIMDNWEEMVDRWWKEPQNTLKQDATHEPERLLVSRLMGYLLLEDSSMYLKIFHPSSHTLSLISRHWVHCTSANIARLNLSILRSIIFFKFSQNVEEYLKGHEKPPLDSLLDKIYTGIRAPSVFSQSGELQTSAQYLLKTMSNRLALGDPSYAVEDLGFCHDVYVGLREFAASSSNTSELDDFADALRNSEEYWRNAFALMHIKNPDKSAHTEKEVSIAVLNLALKLILQRPVPEVAQLLRNWIKTGLFGVLDETMEDLIRVPGATRLLTFFYTTIKESCLSPSFPVDVLEAIKDEFPRQRAVGAVMRYETEQKGNQQSNTTQKNVNEDDIPDAEDPIWINGLWQAMGWLEGVCHRDHPEHEGAPGIENRIVVTTGSTLCTRRSCGKKAVSKCSSCKEFWYCGVECQRLDWKEHKSICKNNFAAPYMQTVRAGTKRLTGGNAAKLGLMGLGPNDSEFDTTDTSNANTVTVVDRLKGLSDYMTPIAFLILVVAAQAFGIWDDLGRWIGVV